MEIIDVDVWGFEHAIRGMRNPKESWQKSDSFWSADDIPNTTGIIHIGQNDMKLCKRLIRGGTEHRKFLRQIWVSFDLVAPIYFYKEFDTYKIGGVTANSTSTMHMLSSTPITVDCFEIDDYEGDDLMIDSNRISVCVNNFIAFLEELRKKYLATNDKKYWKELIRWLPQGWKQRRTVTMNYETLLNIYKQRRNHKLTEWHYFCQFIKRLPYMKDFMSAFDTQESEIK